MPALCANSSAVLSSSADAMTTTRASGKSHKDTFTSAQDTPDACTSNSVILRLTFDSCFRGSALLACLQIYRVQRGSSEASIMVGELSPTSKLDHVKGNAHYPGNVMHNLNT